MISTQELPLLNPMRQFKSSDGDARIPGRFDLFVAEFISALSDTCGSVPEPPGPIDTEIISNSRYEFRLQLERHRGRGLSCYGSLDDDDVTVSRKAILSAPGGLS